MTDTTDIALLGGGPIGLAAALLLARAGFAPTLYDARDPAAAADDPRLLALAHSSWQILAPLLGGRMPATAPIVDVRVSSAGEFGRLDFSGADLDARAAPALGATVHYGALVAALDAAAAAEPRLRLRRPLRVTRTIQREDEVELVLAGAGGEERATAALAVHAEGAPAAADEVAATDDWALLAELRLAGADAGTAFERFTREGPLALLPAPAADGPRWALIWCMNAAQARRRLALDDAALRGELQQAVGPRLATVLDCGPRRAVPLPQRARAQLVDHRQVWIGNAAQTLHPVAGQGLNLGLRDALTLADCLARERADPPAALARYAQRRRADRALLRGITRWLPPLSATPLLPVAAARQAGLAALTVAPTLRRQCARLLMFGLRN